MEGNDKTMSDIEKLKGILSELQDYVSECEKEESGESESEAKPFEGKETDAEEEMESSAMKAGSKRRGMF